MNDVWIQLILTSGTVIGALFFTIRYAIKETNKGKDSFLKYLEKMQEQQLQYYEVKNGNIERISNLFAQTIDKNTSAVQELVGKFDSKSKPKVKKIKNTK